MKMITHLFVDVGGVLLTNGWDHESRKRACKHFHLSWEEFEARHHVVFELFEVGKITLHDYLKMCVFYEKRPFSLADFRKFIFNESKPHPKMLQLISDLKERYKLKIAIVNNEAKEINQYRIDKFKLDRLADVLISSCFVGLRKPDPAIYRLALDVTQADPKHTLYIENTALFVEEAKRQGISSILHKDFETTKKQLARHSLFSRAFPRSGSSG